MKSERKKVVKKQVVIAYEYMQPSVAAHYLRELHEQCGLSYKHIAEQVGVSVQTVSRWLHAEIDASWEIQPAKQIALWDLVEKHLGISGKAGDATDA